MQDDFCALMPGGKVYATENGCFAKTFGLNPNDEPTIYHACASPHAYLENVSQNDEGKVDYFDTSYTPNGRAVIRMEDIAGAADAREIDEGRLPADPQPQREHHPGRGEARGAARRRVLHARRDEGHQRRRRRGSRQVAARAGHESVLPAAARATRATACSS